MGLYFQNGTQDTLYLAYAYHAPGCEGGTDWAKKGWYGIAPGGTAKVLSGWAGPGKYFVFAENDSHQGVERTLLHAVAFKGIRLVLSKPGVATAVCLVLPRSRWAGESSMTRCASTDARAHRTLQNRPGDLVGSRWGGWRRDVAATELNSRGNPSGKESKLPQTVPFRDPTRP